jgi:hypothetical protein
MSDEKPIVRVLGKQFQPTAILVAAGLVVLGAVITGQGVVDAHIRSQAVAAMAAPDQLAAIDTRIDQRARSIVDSPDRIAHRSEMIEKHGEYERAISQLSIRAEALERSDGKTTLALSEIALTLRQVQKDVQEIRDDQRARGRAR